MPEMILKLPAVLGKPGFAYGVCGPFTKNKERIQKLKKKRDTKYIYKNELDKDCFQNNMVYGDFKDLAKKELLIKF